MTVLSLFCSLHKEDQSVDQNHISFSPLEVTRDPLPEEGHPHGPRRSPQCEVPLGRGHLCLENLLLIFRYLKSSLQFQVVSLYYLDISESPSNAFRYSVHIIKKSYVTRNKHKVHWLAWDLEVPFIRSWKLLHCIIFKVSLYAIHQMIE